MEHFTENHKDLWFIKLKGTLKNYQQIFGWLQGIILFDEHAFMMKNGPFFGSF